MYTPPPWQTLFEVLRIPLVPSGLSLVLPTNYSRSFGVHPRNAIAGPNNGTRGSSVLRSWKQRTRVKPMTCSREYSNKCPLGRYRICGHCHSHGGRCIRTCYTRPPRKHVVT
ncbi:unnamed protein product [Ectocarpus sp. 13 AM-2016]